MYELSYDIGCIHTFVGKMIRCSCCLHSHKKNKGHVCDTGNLLIGVVALLLVK